MCPEPARWSPPDVARPWWPEVAGISRQAIYRPLTRPAAAGPGHGRPGDHDIVEVAKANPTDGTRMVAALASRELGEAVNRKRAQRVMRAHGLLQPSRGAGRRRRPGFFRVTRPDELWHMDMTKVWTAAHGWVYLHVIIDGCTRQIVGWTLDLRTRSTEAIACVEAALLARDVRPGTLTIGTLNGSQFFKKRCAWRAEWESIDHARREITAYIDTYHHRPHSGIGYRTPAEVAQNWRTLQTRAT